jgi:hypothetical protein
VSSHENIFILPIELSSPASVLPMLANRYATANSTMIRKLGTFFSCIILATFIAGFYGALHDQITFSISSEYFTVFKFEQFGFLDWGNNCPRMTTAIIGFMATWWMGFLIGLMQSLVGLIHKDYKLMFKYVMKSVFITLGITVCFEIVGGIVGLLNNENLIEFCCFPYDIKDRENFVIVGSIHNFAYIGGVIGALAGIIYQAKRRKNLAVA